MELPAILLLPTLAGLISLMLPRYPRTFIAAAGILLTLIPIWQLAAYADPPQLDLPILFYTRWAYHPYCLGAATGFAVVGALVVLFCGVSFSAPQLLALTVSLSAALGIVFSSSFVSLFLCWEALTIAVSAIILFDQQPKIGIRFLTIHLVGGLLLLFGIFSQYTASGSMVLQNPEAGTVFFLLGIGMKAAVFPLHFWVLQTYPRVSAETTIALSILTTKAGLFMLIRILSGFEPLVFAGVIMLIYGALAALAQTQLRLFLVYQHIAQIGLIVVAAGFGGYSGINGAYLHMLSHLSYQPLLFMLASTAVPVHHTATRLQRWVITLSIICSSAALIGLPFTNGFVSKSMIKYAAGNTDAWALFFDITSVVIAYGCIQMYHHLCSSAASESGSKLSLSALVSLGGLSSLIFAIGLAPRLLAAPLAPYPIPSIYAPEAMLRPILAASLGIGLFLLSYRYRKETGCILAPPAWLAALQHGSKRYLQHISGQCTRAGRKFCALEDTMTQLSNAPYLLILLSLLLLLALVLVRP